MQHRDGTAIPPQTHDGGIRSGMTAQARQGLLASPSDDLKTQAPWVIGTAVQNNPAAQKAVRYKIWRQTRPRLSLGFC
jgi:hypothetical protein